MPSKRKVYIESSIPQDEINKKFSFLDTKFDRTCNIHKADFTIFDLNNPVSRFQRELVDGGKRLFICRSCILVALDGEEKIAKLDYIKENFCNNPPVYKQANEVISALEWLDFTLSPISKELRAKVIDINLAGARKDE